MPYRFLEDIAVADVAFEAEGKTREEMFIAAADAMMNVMLSDLETLRMTETVAFSLQNRDIELLLFDFLNELIFYKDAHRLLLRVATVTINLFDTQFTLSAKAAGERLDPARHPLIVDVKAVTLYRFRVEETSEGWLAEVILDI